MEKDINPSDYLKFNKESWNLKTDVHYDSDFYDNENFIKGKNSLCQIELDLIGDVKGKSILHLQCHFGQDSISWSRMGAEVTGVDFSDRAIDKANKLNALTGQNVDFICCDIYDLDKHLDKKYDIVFTSYGTIGWLPDLDKWADIVSHFTKENGKFNIIEFHPVIWMYDDHFKEVAYSYFNAAPIIESYTGTYTDKDKKSNIKQQTISWNHPLSEVINSLINKDFKIEKLNEYNYSPYDCFEETTKIEDRKYRIKHMHDHLPMVYAIQAQKE